ncbi:unnamed protein product [Mytilus coruscus]|uniref:WSC domain-containing protein n=1 Tax=Mytilus coruscus TaxID=42192 RepID=A0A6J8ALC0_MYTCO|nr:unnamed protein product [Mytilus coruscus]
MYNEIIFVISIFSVINLKCTDSAVVDCCYTLIYKEWDFPIWDLDVTNIWCENMCKAKSSNYQYSGTIVNSAVVDCCYTLIYKEWDFSKWDLDVTNIWCENMCKAKSSNYQYSGTISERCFCGNTTLYQYERDWPDECTNTYNCANDTSEICGERTSQTRSNEIAQTTSKTPLGIKGSPTPIATCVGMKTNDTSLAIETQSTPLITRELYNTSENTVSTAIIEISRHVTTNTAVSSTDANGEWSMWDDWKFCEVNCIRGDTTNGTQRRWRTCNGSKCSGKDMEERKCSKAGICKGMRPGKLLCKCPKRLINTKWHFLDGKNLTNSEVKKMVLEDFNKNIKSKILIDKKTVSKEVRRKNSSVNKGKSAQSIGWGCIVFLIFPMVFLIAIDILNCCIHFRTRHGSRKRNRFRPISNIQDQRDNSKPLQENVNITESYYDSRSGNNFHPDEMKRETYQRRRDDHNQQSRDEWLQYI